VKDVKQTIKQIISLLTSKKKIISLHDALKIIAKNLPSTSDSEHINRISYHKFGEPVLLRIYNRGI
jgi:hypothetical protein